MLGRKDVDDLASRPKSATRELDVVAFVLHGHQPPQQFLASNTVAAAQGQHHGVIIAWIAYTVYAGHRAHDDRVAPFQQRSEEHTSELQSLMRISYAVFCLKKKNKQQNAQ